MNGPSGDWPDEVDYPGGGRAGVDGERFSIEATTLIGGSVVVEFLIRLDTVEVWARERCRAVLDRQVLRNWLAKPRMPLVVDGVAFSLDGMVDASGRKTPSLPGVQLWLLSPEELTGLRQQI